MKFNIMKQFEPIRTPDAKEIAKQKLLSGLLTDEEKIAIGLQEPVKETSQDLREILDPILEENMEFLDSFEVVINGWEDQLVSAQFLPLKEEEAACKTLLKKMVNLSDKNKKPIYKVESYGGQAEKAKLAQLKERAEYLRSKVMEVIMKPYGKSKA
jgi:hypothetical protein